MSPDWSSRNEKEIKKLFDIHVWTLKIENISAYYVNVCVTSGQCPRVWLGVITTLVVTKNAPFSAGGTWTGNIIRIILMFVLGSPYYHVVSLVPDPLIQHPQAGRHPQPHVAVQLGDWVSFHLNYSALSDFWIFYRIIKLLNDTIDTCEVDSQLWCLRTLVVVLDSTVLNSWYPWAYHSWYRPTYRTTNSCKQRRSRPWEGHQVSSIKIMEWREHR